MSTFESKKCKPCEGSTAPMSEEEIRNALKQTDGWEFKDGVICREFSFKNYYETVSFVNGVVWIAHREDHHPDISFGYKKVTVNYSTHAIGGISENDFICAAKINKLLA